MITVIGAGPWGTAVASLLKRNGNDVKLWAFQNILDKDIKPLEGITVTDDVKEAVNESEYIFVVLNSQFFISTLDSLDFNNLKDKRFIVLTKGLVEFQDIYHLSFEILIKKYNVPKENIAVLSGPNIAKEIYNQMPAATVVASENPQLLSDVKELLSNNNFAVETSNDMAGVQWCGILKNPVAVGFGILEGLYSEASNPKSAFIAQALQEMQNILTTFGGKPGTLLSAAGIGDLITTCLSGRNKRVGIMLAQGKTLEEIYDSFKPQRPEGPEQVEILFEKMKLDNPIISKLYNILFKSADPKTLTR
ncbi:NAD(P)-binding domain-containing protein [Candidatus Woesearchaeota archaeon]|nr:NAD(P)-binding domain-containing protein [Candidatus Woesearchaeota archaeon]